MAKPDAYLDTLEDLVGHPGWRILEDEFRKKIYQFQADSLDINVCKTWDQVNVLRGAAEQLSELLRLPEMLKVMRDAQDSGE